LRLNLNKTIRADLDKVEKQFQIDLQKIEKQLEGDLKKKEFEEQQKRARVLIAVAARGRRLVNRLASASNRATARSLSQRKANAAIAHFAT